MRDAVTDFLSTSHPCLLLVHPEIRTLERAAGELVSAYAWPRLSLGRELCAVLLSETSPHRSRTARQWIKTCLGGLAPGPVLCSEVDLLFEPTLELDPLGLLCDAGRLTRLVVAWPGTYQGDVLAYAVPGHGHYRAWRRPGVSVAVL